MSDKANRDPADHTARLREIADKVRASFRADMRYTITVRPRTGDFLVAMALREDEDYYDYTEAAVLVRAGLYLAHSGYENGYLWGVWAI